MDTSFSTFNISHNRPKQLFVCHSQMRQYKFTTLNKYLKRLHVKFLTNISQNFFISKAIKQYNQLSYFLSKIKYVEVYTNLVGLITLQSFSREK